MPLPQKSYLANQIKIFLQENKTKDPNKAIDDFCDFIAGVILDTIRAGDVKGVQTIVTVVGPNGPLTGSGTQNNIGKIS